MRRREDKACTQDKLSINKVEYTFIYARDEACDFIRDVTERQLQSFSTRYIKIKKTECTYINYKLIIYIKNISINLHCLSPCIHALLW